MPRLVLFKNNVTSVTNPIEPISTLYPNPVNNIINIKLENGTNDIYNALINDLSGKKILSIPGLILQNNLISINVSQLGKGNYFLTLSTYNFNKTYKLIKD